MTVLIDLPAARDVALAAETLLPALRIDVPNAVAYQNVGDYRPDFAAHLMRDVYAARSAHLDQVDLLRLPAGATILAGGDHVLAAAGRLVADQYPPYLADPPVIPSDAADIDGDVLLLARFGIYTWGHWLGELLPKAVLAEAAHPGRFRYAVPAQVLQDASPDQPWLRIRESLLAFGIASARLVPLDPAQAYRFAALHAVSPIWSDHMVHPGATGLMRSALQLPAIAGTRRIAIARVARYGRRLENRDEIDAILRDAGFEFHVAATLSFREQVALFAQCGTLVGTLGSDLTGLLFAPRGVRTITLAPESFGDRFFYALVLDRHGHQIDLRGPVTAPDGALEHLATFRIAPVLLRRALKIFGL